MISRYGGTNASGQPADKNERNLYDPSRTYHRRRNSRVGTVVHIYDEGAAYEVEFCTLSGDPVAVVTVTSDQVRPVGERDLTHARSL